MSSGSHSEAWRPVAGFPSYEVSTLGRVRRAAKGKGTRAGRVRKPYEQKDGYRQIDLWVEGARYRFYLHQIVALTFHGPAPTPDHQVAHWDGDKGNNQPGNVRWATRTENGADTSRLGRQIAGETHPHAKITNADVVAIRERRAQGETLAAIGGDFGLSFQNVDLICRRVTWTHV